MGNLEMKAWEEQIVKERKREGVRDDLWNTGTHIHGWKGRDPKARALSSLASASGADMQADVALWRSRSSMTLTSAGCFSMHPRAQTPLRPVSAVSSVGSEAITRTSAAEHGSNETECEVWSPMLRSRLRSSSHTCKLRSTGILTRGCWRRQKWL
mmetsp:Transcript_84225/g.160904  ORF Transcript_84225/g.160904 Transcript_84225/m.160904 type:complete len:155 (-) Transcript_84225:40-504(-)